MNYHIINKNSVDMYEVRLIIPDLETSKVVNVFNNMADAEQYAAWLERRLVKIIEEEKQKLTL